MPSDVVPQCWPCLLLWCLTIGYACWRVTSLSAMSVGVVPQYGPCLLAWYFNIGHACWSVAIFYDGRRMVTSLVLPVQRCHYIRCLLIPRHTHICLLVQYNSIRHACWVHLFRCVYLWCFSIRQGMWSVKNPSDMPTGKVLLPLVCKLVGYHPGRHLEYIKF